VASVTLEIPNTHAPVTRWNQIRAGERKDERFRQWMLMEKLQKPGYIQSEEKMKEKILSLQTSKGMLW